MHSRGGTAVDHQKQAPARNPRLLRYPFHQLMVFHSSGKRLALKVPVLVLLLFILQPHNLQFSVYFDGDALSVGGSDVFDDDRSTSFSNDHFESYGASEETLEEDTVFAPNFLRHSKILSREAVETLYGMNHRFITGEEVENPDEIRKNKESRATVSRKRYINNFMNHVIGCEISKAQRDKIRQAFDFCTCTGIFPRLPPRLARIRFHVVEKAPKERYVIEITVSEKVACLYQIAPHRICYVEGGEVKTVQGIDEARIMLTKSLRDLELRHTGYDILRFAGL
ncbi:unnamed protein product [Heligmosomoides polygyrus]|uniref:Transmembrane protein n=1 Tax=Heligmosomoides polygyrus TaxID=6339 RepID=A0A3P8CFM3_HELPZ|nr:unnamed protein product [Heligmosomoides polygyrus]